MKTFKTIYFVKGNSPIDERSVFISYLTLNNTYLACTNTQSKMYKTLNGAMKFMLNNGYNLPSKK